MDTKSKEGLRHYFIAREHSKDDYFEFNMNFLSRNYTFKSCSDVFSKNQVDEGSLVLINTILKKEVFKDGSVLDMCCGYGPIGILLATNLEIELTMCDINSTSVALAKENAKINQCQTKDIFESNMFECVKENYDHIVSNPPIKTGKKVLMDFVNGAYEHLNVGGDLTLVIKKNLGADSLKKKLTELFGNAEVLQRDRGYYILHSVKK